MHFNSTYTLNPQFIWSLLCIANIQDIFIRISIYLFFLLLSISFCSCMFFSGVIFLVSEELSLVFIWGQFFWQRSLSFYLTECGFISPSFLQDNLSRHRILDWSILFFSTSEIFYCLHTSILSVEKVAVSLNAASLKFSKILSLVLRSLNMIRPGVAFFVFIMLLILWILEGWFLSLSFQILCFFVIFYLFSQDSNYCMLNF